MNVNIYYGGRGLIEDPTQYVLSKIETVLKEIRVNVTRYNLYDMKSSIITLPQTLKEADGVILAASVEWMGIGGYLTEFLDSCWLYADKSKLSKTYMMPVVISTTYGEKEAITQLKNAWDLLGGKYCSGICAYVADNIEFEMNKDYTNLIEKKAENMYRTISQKIETFPSSVNAIKNNIMRETIDLTPQESEQLSRYVSDDVYVKQQKEDIEELASMFKGMLVKQGTDVELEFIHDFKTKYNPHDDFSATYMFIIEDKKKELLVKVTPTDVTCTYEKDDNADVVAKLNYEMMNNIINGRVSFQRAFMTGDMTAKGNFKTLRMLDQIFAFA